VGCSSQPSGNRRLRRSRQDGCAIGATGAIGARGEVDALAALRLRPAAFAPAGQLAPEWAHFGEPLPRDQRPAQLCRARGPVPVATGCRPRVAHYVAGTTSLAPRRGNFVVGTSSSALRRGNFVEGTSSRGLRRGDFVGCRLRRRHA
jgi:hypothetical protein